MDTNTNLVDVRTINKHHSQNAMMFVNAKLLILAAAVLLAAGAIWFFGNYSSSHYNFTVPAGQKQAQASNAAPPPKHITIPAIKVNASVVDLGLAKDGSLELPQTAADVGWYTGSAAPGTTGAAVMVGHLDWWTTKYGVFYNLRGLKPGDAILITREDNSQVTYKVDSLKYYAQNAFPTDSVYGTVPDSELRLITCAGKFNFISQHYSQNLIVYASLATPTSN